MTNVRVGVMYDRDWDPAGLAGFARQAEETGLDDLWVVEDLGWNGGVSAAAIALGATARLRVGIGIAPAPLRSPALLAMELATLERAFPGRLVAGIGHGASNWMAQVGAAPRSPLAMLDETVTSVRALLRGEKVELDGREVRLDGVRLVHPPQEVPPLVAGVVQPRSLELAGRVADGTLLAEGHGPDDVRTALELARKGGAGDGFGVIAYAAGAIDDDPARAAAALRTFLEGHAAWLGRTPEELFSVSGTAAQAAGRVDELAAAGAETVVLRVFGPDPLRQLAALLAARAA
jgi:alkanesulfonate monooxygenase SsuD/methylene tetrahydromethanopterin reductase-like flavin-dependent oxidoreductase (luciferase family)